MKSTLKVGIIQQANTNNREDNQHRLAKKILDLAAQGAELIVLQELHDSYIFAKSNLPTILTWQWKFLALPPIFTAKLRERQTPSWLLPFLNVGHPDCIIIRLLFLKKTEVLPENTGRCIFPTIRITMRNSISPPVI